MQSHMVLALAYSQDAIQTFIGHKHRDTLSDMLLNVHEQSLPHRAWGSQRKGAEYLPSQRWSNAGDYGLLEVASES